MKYWMYVMGVMVAACGAGSNATSKDLGSGGAVTESDSGLGGSGGREAATGGQTSSTGGQSSATGGRATATGGRATATGGRTTATGGRTTATGGRTTATGGRTSIPPDAGTADAQPLSSLDLCAGLIQDKAAHPMTALAKPAQGEAVTDAEFGTTIRRITAVTSSASNPSVIKPVYSTVSTWNADESMMMLFNVAVGTHELYDGRTYKYLRALAISPADIEQVYWHTADPDVLFYVDDKSFIRYHVGDSRKETMTTFSFCSGGASGGSDPMFTSFDSSRIGLHCGDQVFIYEISSNTVIARKTINEGPAQVAPSGTLAYLSDSGRVTDESLNVLRTLDLQEPFGHACMGRWPTGEDTWNGQVFDDGPKGNSDIGSLVTFDLTRGTSKVIIGPKTGYPYPPDGHISTMAYRRAEWAFVSSFGKTNGAGLMDQEILVANTMSGTVCRVGRHRSWGKDNTKISEPYWAEAHAIPSPSGTRIAFASDWGNGNTVDTYVVELPTYQP